MDENQKLILKKLEELKFLFRCSSDPRAEDSMIVICDQIEIWENPA